MLKNENLPAAYLSKLVPLTLQNYSFIRNKLVLNYASGIIITQQF